jgi:type VI secretion system secreted protein VgrG
MMEITTPFTGDNALLFHRMRGRAELSQLFHFQLDLLAKEDAVIEFDKILGKSVTVALEQQDESLRYFNGIVSRFRYAGRHGRHIAFHAEMVPWTWLLTKTADCRIFQEKTVPDIVNEVLGEHPADVSFELSNQYRKWTYCVQYRETDFNFISRLLEHEGIFYYFRHTDGHHTMVLTDDVGKLTTTPGCETLPFFDPRHFVRPEVEYVSRWDYSQEVQPGKYVHTDYDLERPGVNLRTQKVLPRGYQPSDYEIFDYPGYYLQKGDGEQYADVRINELGSQYEMGQGLTNARGASVGSLFTLEGCPRADQNCEYVIVAGEYELEYNEYEATPEEQQDATRYSCRFTAMPTKQQFRPRRITPKPFVQGPQTAVVVGPGGEEIYTDKYGRVKVQFHWDRVGEKNEKSSCWIRVSHPWAGKAWGAVSIPRIGQEVIVDFLEGDPDQPIITGRVYNAEQMPPYELEANKTQSGLVTRSSPGGSPETFNELMFEDKKGSELIYMRAEKDYTNAVENDEVRWVGHDKWTEVDNDETNHIYHDRTETVDNNETITIGNIQDLTVKVNRIIDVGNDHTEAIHGAMSLTVDRTKTETVTINSAETIGGGKELTIGGLYQVSVGGAHNTTVGGLKMVEVGGLSAEAVGGKKTVGIGGDHSITVGGKYGLQITKDRSVKVTGKADEEIKKEYTLKAKKITLQAEDEVLISVGKAKIAMKKDGTVLIEGKDLSLKASGKINQKASSDLILKGSKIAEN